MSNWPTPLDVMLDTASAKLLLSSATGYTLVSRPPGLEAASDAWYNFLYANPPNFKAYPGGWVPTTRGETGTWTGGWDNTVIPAGANETLLATATRLKNAVIDAADAGLTDGLSNGGADTGFDIVPQSDGLGTDPGAL
jgi:hypothetical protein